LPLISIRLHFRGADKNNLLAQAIVAIGRPETQAKLKSQTRFQGVFCYCGEALARLPGLCGALFFAPEVLPAAWEWVRPAGDPAGLCVIEPLADFGVADFEPFDTAVWAAAWVAAAADAAAVRLRREAAVWVTGAGSATCSLRPASTRMPEGIPFQRRNSLSETPNRSAIVTRVSPRRVV
jgi:hypothetical protein